MSPWRSYDVTTHTADRPEELPLRPGEVSPEIRSQLPEETLWAMASPSRQRVLYVVALAPTPTPDRSVDGERRRERTPADLRLMEDQTHHRIGPFEDCVEYSLWSADERVVIAQSWHLLHCEAHAWLLDLEALQVTTLVPREGEYVQAIDLSPSGQQALLRSKEDGRLYTLDTSSSVTHTLAVAQWAWGKWLDERYVIVGQNLSPGRARWTYDTLWLYDTASGEQTQIFDTQRAPGLAEQEYAGMSLSPDHRWLALIAHQDLLETEGRGDIWVLRLDSLD